MEELIRELEDLKQKRKSAIENCQFPRAKALDSHIKSLKLQIEENKIQNKKLNSRIKFNTTKESISKELAASQNSMNNQEKMIRSSFQQRLLDLEAKNQQESEELAEKLSFDLQKTNQRPVTEAEDLKSQAKKHASMGNFDLAEKIFEESNKIRDKVLNERLEEITQKYTADSLELETKHEEEIKNCKAKRDLAIKQLYDSFDLEIERKTKELNTVSLKLGLGSVEPDILSKTVTVKKPVTESSFEEEKSSTTTTLTTTKKSSIPRKSPMLHAPQSRLSSSKSKTRQLTPHITRKSRTSSLKK